MKKYIISVTESINHVYEVEAESREAAIEAYYALSDEELKTKDLDGDASWDTPWDVAESDED